MRILGIDYGHKRIGLAVSDELGLLARELETLSPQEFWLKMPEFIAKYEIGSIVVGWPLNMSGGATAKTSEVETFAEKLRQEFALPVILIDERLSSQMAASIASEDKDIDSLAAQIILQNYLDQQRN